MEKLAVDNLICYNAVMEMQKYLNFITEGFKEKFSRFKTLLSEYNRVCNLTSITDEKEVIYKHFLDSIAGESCFFGGAHVIEIGSGGGFPSIPLKIIRDDLSFTLIESTGKKCRFLQSAVENLGLNCVQVLNIRAEDGARDKNLREKFDIACARAVARLNTLCEYCLPYVKKGGLFIAYKGDCEEELNEAHNAISILGGKIKEVISYELPEGAGSRKIVVIEKIKNTPDLYPRGQGKERKKPL